MRFWRKRRTDDARLLRCSFCNKSQRDVKKLIAGPTVYICDECVDICVDILREDLQDELAEAEANPLELSTQCSLCRTPTLLAHGVVVRNRGFLCPGCIGEIQAAIAEREGPADDTPA